MKQALLDKRFRDSLPIDFTEDIQKFLRNPGCSCNHPIYKKIMTNAADQIASYYPTKQKIEPADIEAEEARMMQNNWTVINCKVQDLAEKLRSLPHGRKQLDIARWQDEVTVVINDLEMGF